MALPLGSPTLSLDISVNHSQDKKSILKRPFTHALTLILPNTTVLPKAVTECFWEQLTYKVMKLPVYRLIERPFVQAFVKKGSTCVMSVNTKLDSDNSVAITPAGWLILHLTKQTYQELGLEATKQTHAQKISDVYVVKINLLADYFKPGKKGYDSTLWCLKGRLNLEFDFLVSWYPHDEKVCSSSVGSYFEDKCLRVERLDLNFTWRVATSLPYPKIDPSRPYGEDGLSCHFQEVFEWVGAVACDNDLSPDSSGYVNSMTAPDPSSNCPRCLVVQVSGFLSPRTVLKVWDTLRLHPSSNSESFPASLTLHGFSNSIFIDNTTYNTYGVCGDNLLTLLSLSKDMSWHITASAS